MPSVTPIGFRFDIDHASFTRDMNAIARKAISRAAAAVTNRAAREAVVALKEHAIDVFDRPKPMTAKAFDMRPARIRGGNAASASASVFIKEPAASYLYRQIEGGVRRTGEDGGSGPRDLFTYALRPDRYGGVPRGESRRLSTKNRREKAARKSARAAGAVYGKKGGVFFGEVNGVKGYWRRPRKHDGSPILLLKVQPVARYRKIFRFEETVRRSYRLFASQREFGRELDREIARVLAGRGGKK
ncbi:hypothetical protein [Aureimonas sp. SK2]|uniref:hypothetical protein n=1 Tax=Aureimonas sp. SK2 TaxID=3015992 RepID=UPI002444F9D3|nr:hypothetical protein [Aureimonas sp. SK2]